MKEIITYLRSYILELNLKAFFLTSLFVAILIALNYTLDLEQRIADYTSYGIKFLAFTLLFTFTFVISYLIHFSFSDQFVPLQKFFFLLLVLAPAIFGAKVSMDWLTNLFTMKMAYPWDHYATRVLSWPLKCLVTIVLITTVWRMGKYSTTITGLSAKRFNMKPYLLLLLCMVPLLAFASTQPDFLLTYPKAKTICFIEPYVKDLFIWQVLFEMSYGIDFITIETFFRGFLILAFVRYVGRHAILPMAAFYCAIHFGKPLFECITSYFGGIILGVIVYNTRSIWGGLMVHLGIAWLMEIGGYLGNYWK